MATFVPEKYHYLFFDIDGVVLDSVNVKTEAFYELYLPYGEDVAQQVMAHHLVHGGMSRFEKFRIYHQEYLGQSLDEAKLQKLAEEFSHRVFDQILRVPFLPGALEFLQLMQGQKKEMFVITGTPQDETERLLEGRDLKKYFLSVKGSPRKKQDSLREVIEERNIPVEKAVLFGDSVTDREAASLNGVEFIPINYQKPPDGCRDFAELIQRSGL